MKVLNFGSLNLDYVYSVDHMVTPGETLASYGMNVFCGGKGLNQSIALAKAGVEVYHAGLIGEEGEILLKTCQEGGVDSRYIRKTTEKSGHTIIQVDKDGQNCILLYGGANQSITREYVDEVLSHFEKGDILLLQNEINLLDYIINQAYEKGMMIILNPSPYNEKLDSCDFKKISMLLLNEVEGAQVTGEKDEKKILVRLRELYPDMQVVLTLGKDGSVYQYKDQVYRQGIFSVQAVDTTAAGDTFTGYFLRRALEGGTLEEALSLAAAASALAVSRPGAADAVPGYEEVLRIL